MTIESAEMQNEHAGCERKKAEAGTKCCEKTIGSVLMQPGIEAARKAAMPNKREKYKWPTLIVTGNTELS